MNAAALALVLLLAYLLGSLPFAVLVSRALGLADPRSFGSGNPGATNVLRGGNRLAAALTLIGDAAKGAAAVVLCRAIAETFSLGPAAPAWAGAAAFAGHLYPVFLRFRGGKGVATFLGTLLALVPLVGVATCLLWLGIAALFRYSSVASVVCAISASLALFGIESPPGARAAVVLMSAFLLWRHRRNIAKLLSGTESKIGERASSSAAPPG
ncbi:1-acyl glycerol-3-phosphate synthetase component [Burkholderiales bacterium]|nr:1-acyl glycerol-3-phosphate synthetase component [Burkholderiales bacterium]